MLTEMNYLDVYLLCQTANNLLLGGFERLINDFFENLFTEQDSKTTFSKESYLHYYCEWVITEMIWDESENTADRIRNCVRIKKNTIRDWFGTLWVDELINRYQKDVNKKTDFLSFYEHDLERINDLSDEEINDYIYNYLSELAMSGWYDDCVNKLAKEMFYLLFQNRDFLFAFNHMLSFYHQMSSSEVSPRVRIPKWAKRAVWFRDKGCCVFCGKDLSGIRNNLGDRAVHYDHMISLADYGVNDVSNLQLTCKDCNLHKLDKSGTCSKYHPWYN